VYTRPESDLPPTAIDDSEATQSGPEPDASD